jgi:hypothetical protein
VEDRLTPSFNPVTSLPAGLAAQNPQATVVGDVNNDGHLDLVMAFNSTSVAYVSVLLGNTDGTFQEVQVDTDIDPISVAVGDFDSDGKLDLVVFGEIYVIDPFDDTGGHYEVRTEMLLGNGDGTFQNPYPLDIAEPVTVGDFNNDGALDLGVVSYQGFNLREVTVLLGNGYGSFSDPITSATGQAGDSGYGVATDINGDGNLDVVLDGWSMLGDGLGHLSFAGAPVFSDYTSVAFGDVNGDGKIDVVKAHASNNTVSVELANGLGGFAPAQNFAVVGPGSVVLGDFNGDGWLDVATASSNGGNSSLLTNDGNWPPPPPPPVPSITIHDSTVTEGNAGARAATFTVTLSAASTQPINVAYATGDGTATAGSDYQTASGTLTFAPGETSKTVSVLVKGDRLAEPNETFNVNLSGATNATIADAQGLGTILDDEPRISITDVSKQEGKKGQTTQFTFTVTLSAVYDQPVTVSFRTTDGTAKTSDNDYVAQTGTITFKPGETTKTITIIVNGDGKKEADEYFYLDLFGNSTNSLLTKSRGIGTIQNDD